MWKHETGTLISTLLGHSSGVLNLNLDLEDGIMVSYSENGEVIYWDYYQGKKLNITTFGQGQITA